jgi:hypothetical protein
MCNWETKWLVSWFDCDESLTCRALNSNPRHFGSFTFIPISFGESCLLIPWRAAGRCGMACSNEDHGRSRRPGAEDCGWLGDQEVGWHCVWSAPCMWRQRVLISWLSLKTRVNGLWVVWPQNHSDDFLQFGPKTGGDRFPGLGLKTGNYGLMIWASKSPRRFLGLGLKTKWASVYRLCHKTDSAGHASRSGGLLCLEASLATVSQSGLKTDRCVTTGGARDIITKVVWSSSWRWTGRYDGLRRTLLPLFCHFLYIRP